MDDASKSAPVAEEDRARADCYALISRLFYAAPNPELLQQLRGEDSAAPATDDGPLELLWDEPQPGGYSAALAALQQECRDADPMAIRQEFDELFVGAGRAVVTPYTSGYAVPHAPDRHLLALREHLAAWGLVRREAVYEVEDHVSAVCDVMRWLIEHDRPLEMQHRFFDEFVYTGVGTFCDAIEASPATSFYRAVAGLARAFLVVEKEAFEAHTAE
jgi:TorA maturation chaperone TorD